MNKGKKFSKKQLAQILNEQVPKSMQRVIKTITDLQFKYDNPRKMLVGIKEFNHFIDNYNSAEIVELTIAILRPYTEKEKEGWRRRI